MQHLESESVITLEDQRLPVLYVTNACIDGLGNMKDSGTNQSFFTGEVKQCIRADRVLPQVKSQGNCHPVY